MSRRNQISSGLYKVIAFSTITFLLSSCYSNIEGCLDPESTNYGIEADVSCEDCCEYPILQLNIFHNNGEETFNLGDTIKNNFDQEVILLGYVYLLSDFYVNTEDGFAHEVEDTINVSKLDGVEWVKEDVIRVKRSKFSYDIGTTTFKGDVSTISFRTGILEDLNSFEIITPNSGNSLTTDPDTLLQTNPRQYVTQRILAVPGPEFNDTLVYDVVNSEGINFINIPVEYTSSRGLDKELEIIADYGLWFENINFETMQIHEVETELARNIKNIFKPVE